ncbi:stage II sporulation protein M [Salinithrix halophila]|uniref:Stage II sporulation protein M n=1 Tax=Salinithrix halophila TaxID=1485204 RepID=A0ABV8JGX8_9BACL
MSVQSAQRMSRFVQKNQPLWEELKTLINTVDRAADRATLDRLGKAYRQASAHLAYARTYFPDQPATRHLNALVAQAHQRVYGSVPKTDGKKGIRFFLREFPALFHERVLFFLAALFLFLAGMFFAFTATWVNENNAHAFLPAGMAEQVDPGSIGESQWDHAIVSGQLMANNIQVAFLCFALGALMGVGTGWVLFSNGLLLGSLAALYHRAGEAYAFWAYIWPHGVIELTAIFIAGAAGLSLAGSWLVPGDLSRLESFKREGKVTVKLILGVVPMFVMAALIEAFITPAPWPLWSKYLVALITLGGLFLYFGKPLFPSLSRGEKSA